VGTYLLFGVKSTGVVLRTLVAEFPFSCFGLIQFICTFSLSLSTRRFLLK